MRKPPRETLYALTIRQPWASRILDGSKTVEFRSWLLPKQFVGVEIALHAGSTYDRASGIPKAANTPLGAIIGLVKFGESVQHVEAGMDPETRVWGWPVTTHTTLPKAIPCRGALRFWKVPKKLLRLIRK